MYPAARITALLMSSRWAVWIVTVVADAVAGCSGLQYFPEHGATPLKPVALVLVEAVAVVEQVGVLVLVKAVLAAVRVALLVLVAVVEQVGVLVLVKAVLAAVRVRVPVLVLVLVVVVELMVVLARTVLKHCSASYRRGLLLQTPVSGSHCHRHHHFTNQTPGQHVTAPGLLTNQQRRLHCLRLHLPHSSIFQRCYQRG